MSTWLGERVNLDENGEENDGQRCSDEHLTGPNGTGFEHLNQRETDGAAQSSVRHDELFLQIDRFQSETVGDGSQQEDTYRSSVFFFFNCNGAYWVVAIALVRHFIDIFVEMETFNSK